MDPLNTAELNKTFGLNGKILFTVENELIKFNARSKGSVLQGYLQGAHVTSFIPNGGTEVLWLSPNAKFAKGKAIRGGIPICWPWFGKHPKDAGLPQHGFARNTLFDVEHTTELDNGDLQIVFSMHSNATIEHFWPFKFKLSVIVTVGASLTIELKTENRDVQNISITEAIHTYFAISDIARTQLQGLENAEYYDQLLGSDKVQANLAIEITEEVDRIYRAPANDLLILIDKLLKTRVQQENGVAVVVWNPWIEKSCSMGDFPDDGFAKMLCVEAANARYGAINLEPGQHHSIKQIITPIR